MAHRDPLSPTPLPTILRYGIAVLSVAIASGLGFFLLRYLLVEIRLTPFLFAIAATVWYAGTGPGVLAIVLAVLSLNYFILAPSYSFHPIGYPDLVYLSFCTLCALAVGWVSTVRRRAEQELRQARDELDAKIVERTASLRRSEGYLAEAQRLSHTGTWVLNPTTMQYLYWSDESYRIWGFDPLHGLPSREALWQRIHDRDRVWENVQEALRQKKDYSGEFKIVLPNGTVKYLAATSHHLFSTNGEIVEVIGTNVDVTERKRAEEALRESEYKLRQIVETIPSLVWSADPNFEATHLNQRHLDYYGRQLEDFKRGGWKAFQHPDDLPETVKAISHAVQTGTSFQAVHRLRRADGEFRWHDSRGEPLRDRQGNIIQWYGLTIDIDEAKKAEEALRESEARSRSALDGIAGLVAVLAPNGELETANRQVLEYFGRSLEWIKNWGTNDAVHPEDLPRVVELYKRAIASGIPFNFEVRLRRFDGEYRWFDNRGVPIRDDSGRIARWYSLLTDIEDRTRALAQLEQMQSDFAHMNRVSMMGELAVSLSHEITQPIASARNNARAAQNFLDMQPPDLGEVREALSCLVGDTDRARDMIDRIRDHMKKAPPRKEHFDLNEAINEVIALARTAIIKKGVSVQTRLAEGLCPIYCDRVQLQQVVLNLILNAVEAIGSVEAEPRELSISTEQDHTGVLVAVRDSGPGIDPTHLERVFDRFYTTKGSGMGMGLSICRSIIDAHGGRLWAEANEPRGAVFQFTLPAVT